MPVLRTWKGPKKKAQGVQRGKVKVAGGSSFVFLFFSDWTTVQISQAFGWSLASIS